MKNEVQYVTATVWILVDENGDYVASHDEAKVGEVYDEQIQDRSGLDNPIGFRRVKVSVRVPIPAVIELSTTVEEDHAAAVLAAA